MALALDEKFWTSFVQTNWEKKPCLIKDFSAGISSIDSADIFSWLVKYSDYCRKVKKADGLKFYIDGESQYQNEVLQALPVQSDKSLRGYHERMNRIFPDYCLVCDELIQVSHSKQIELKKLVYNLYRRVGLPNRNAEIGLYLGNYKKTPFGVHVDGCGVFSFPIEGIKRFRLWTGAYVQKNPELEMSFAYKKHLKKSTLLTAKKGDMTYWPSKSWHIAESSGEFSATWSLGVWVDQPYLDLLQQTLKPLLSDKLEVSAQEKMIGMNKGINQTGEISRLPPLFQKSVQLLSSLSKNELYDLLMLQWLVINSKSGFNSAIRPDLGRQLKISDRVMISKENPVLWAKFKDRTIRLASHGQTFSLPNNRLTHALIQKLNSSVAFEVKAVMTSKSVRPSYFNLLQSLFQTGQLFLQPQGQVP